MHEKGKMQNIAYPKYSSLTKSSQQSRNPSFEKAIVKSILIWSNKNLKKTITEF